MNNRQIALAIIIPILTVLVALSVLFARSDQPTRGQVWNTIYHKPINSSGGTTPIVQSRDGDLRLCINGVNENERVTMIVYNDDDGVIDDNDYVIGPILGSIYEPHPTAQTTELCYPKIDVRPYVDGTDNKAELYVKLSASFSNTVSLKIQDKK